MFRPDYCDARLSLAVLLVLNGLRELRGRISLLLLIFVLQEVSVLDWLGSTDLYESNFCQLIVLTFYATVAYIKFF